MSAPAAFVNIPLDQLVESPTNPRRTYNEAALQELAASIREKGVLQPILARTREFVNGPLSASIKERFEIVAGSRRFRAAKLANLAEVPCMVRELTDDQVLEWESGKLDI